MDHDFSGKAALVTGAASGLGKVTAQKLAAAGAKVLLVDISPEVERVAAEIGSPATAFVADLSDLSGAGAVVAKAVARMGRLDVLCNVAGIAFMSHVAELTPEQWQRTMNINVGAVYFLAQAAIPHLIEAKGAIVNVASSAGIQGQAYMVHYSASKAAVIGMTKALAMEFIHAPIRINAIAPSGMFTPMGPGGYVTPPEGADLSLITRYSGLRPAADPAVVADMILVAASDHMANLHGSCISIDQGATAG